MMPEKQEEILVGGPVDGERIAGSVDLICRDCGEPVQVSPAGQRHIAANPGMFTICGGCFEERARRAEKPIHLQPAPGVIKELHQHLLRKRRN